jgi:hypothetical protein
VEVEESCKGFARVSTGESWISVEERVLASEVGGLCGEHRLGIEVFLEGATLLVFLTGKSC